jgi:hypothetical protein
MARTTSKQQQTLVLAGQMKRGSKLLWWFSASRTRGAGVVGVLAVAALIYVWFVWGWTGLMVLLIRRKTGRREGGGLEGKKNTNCQLALKERFGRPDSIEI